MGDPVRKSGHDPHFAVLENNPNRQEDAYPEKSLNEQKNIHQTGAENHGD